jgi:hypothetical protein
MDFEPCPRCQEMNPPHAVKCAACGASMDEAPIEVTPLTLAQEAEAGAAETATPAPEAPPLPPAAAVVAPPARPAGVPPLPPITAPPLPAVPAAPAAQAARPPDVAAQAAALEEQINARPDARGLYIKLADLHQHAGQKDAAINALERLLGLDPANALAKHRIDVLRGTVRHAPPPVAAVLPVMRPARPVAHPSRRRPSRRGLWIGLGALALVLIAGGLWHLSGPSRLVAGRSPVFSPQGDRIAFVTEAASDATLNVYELKTGRSRPLGPAVGFGGDQVAWSPSGRQIAFVGPGDGGMGEETVFVADVESGAPRALATGSSPTWSPDGESVAMSCHQAPRVTATMSTEEGDVPVEFGEGWYGLCLVSVADGSVRRLQPTTGNRLAFSPRTRTLVLERFPEELPGSVASAAPASGDDEFQALADEAVKGGATNFYEGSRDLGRAIEARGLDKRGAGGVGYVAGDLFAIDADTGAMTALTSDGRSSSPRWTADGRIVYVHQPAEASRAELWVMGADGSGKQQLVRAPLELFDPSAVAVGGDRVVYAAPVKDVNTGIAQVMTGEEPADLHLVRPGDEAPRRLKNRHTFKQRFTLSADGRRLVYEANDRKTGQSELWLMKP